MLRCLCCVCAVLFVPWCSVTGIGGPVALVQSTLAACSRLPRQQPATVCSTLQAAAERVAAFKRTMDRCHARVQVAGLCDCCCGCGGARCFLCHCIYASSGPCPLPPPHRRSHL